MVDSRFRLARFTLRAPQGDSVQMAAFVERAGVEFAELLGPGMEASFTGQLQLQARGMEAAIDVFTLQVECIAIGLAVDDTIHLIHGFRRELERSGDPAAAIHATLRVTGRALLFTSLVLVSAFLVFGLSSMNSLRYFGFATALAIALAFVLDVLVTPALLLLVTRRRGMLRA